MDMYRKKHILNDRLMTYIILIFIYSTYFNKKQTNLSEIWD